MKCRLTPPDHDTLVGLAKDWAEGRKPAALVLHLYAMIVQLSIIVAVVAKESGIDLPDASRPASMPPDEVLAGFITVGELAVPMPALEGDD